MHELSVLTAGVELRVWSHDPSCNLLGTFGTEFVFLSFMPLGRHGIQLHVPSTQINAWNRSTDSISSPGTDIGRCIIMLWVSLQRSKAQLHFSLCRTPARRSAPQDSLSEQRLEEEEHAAQSQDRGIRQRASSTFRKQAAMNFVRMTDYSHAGFLRPLQNPPSWRRIRAGTAGFLCPEHACSLRSSSYEEPRGTRGMNSRPAGWPL